MNTAVIPCTSCIRETDKSSKLRAFQPHKEGCSTHQGAPAHAVAARLHAQLGSATRITVTRGEVTVEYVVDGDDIGQRWARAAEACGIPLRWQRLLVSPRDTQVKARVRHGYVDPGMPCEYRRGVPVRLVAHGWADAVDRAIPRDDKPSCVSCGCDWSGDLEPGLNADPYCGDCRITYADQDDHAEYSAYAYN